MKKRLIYSFLIFVLVILVLGVDSCPISSGGVGQQTSKSGLDVSLVQGVGYFNQGMTLDQGDTFKIVLKINNYDTTEKSGTICVKDDKEDVYGGIFDQCTPFYIQAADTQGNVLQAASSTVYLPTSGEYKYDNLPIATSAKLFITIAYVQHSIIQGTVNVPMPEVEMITLAQTSAPVSVSAEKTVSKQGDQYKMSLGINLLKSDSSIILTTEDMKTDNRIKFSAKLSNYNFDCTQGIFEMENTKFIKCSALLPLEQIGYPCLIYLDYGVKQTKTFDFKINAKEAVKSI